MADSLIRCVMVFMMFFFFFKHKTSYEMRISDWSSDVCSSDLRGGVLAAAAPFTLEGNLLIVDHGMGLSSAFLHCQRLDVKLGDRVVQGQRLGKIGRATCREGVGQYVYISGVAVSL